jgi:pyruvate formate lyase activating enzyme
MKGYVFDIKRFAIHDGPGIRTTVFLKGCPLNCWWCHNPESIRKVPSNSGLNENIPNCQNSADIKVVEYSVDKLFEEIQKDTIFFDESRGGVTFSGGEPLIQIYFLSEILVKCRTNGISTIVDTSGYVPYESFQLILDNTDLFLYDLKLMKDEDHQKYTGVSNKLILDNLKKLNENEVNLRVRIPLIPDITDTYENLDAIGDYVSTFTNYRSIDLLPYNKLAEDKYRRLNQKSKLGKLETQSDDKLINIKERLESFGLEVKLKG